MKYNDYPLPTEQLINVLAKEYALNTKVKNQGVCSVGVLEQKSKLNELYIYLTLQNSQVNQLKKLNKQLELKYSPESHLKILCDMGITKTEVLGGGNLRSCLSDFLKGEAEILKILVFLILLDNLNFNKNNLTQILTEQIEIFNEVVNCWLV